MDSTLPDNEVLLPDHGGLSRQQVDLALKALGIGGAVVFQTSGSTGTPRMVCHSRVGLKASGMAVNQLLGAGKEDVWLRALPILHVGGYAISVRASLSKSKVYELQAAWCPGTFVDACETHAATLTSLVPTQVFDLVRDGLRCPDSLRAVLVGGGHLDQDLERQGRELGWPILRTYGLSEAGSQVATQVGQELQVLPHLEVETTADGRLKLRGPSMALGYLRWTDDDAWVFEELVAEDGWFLSDDLVELRGTQLRFLGRASARVKVLGELVDIEALERAFLAGIPSGLEVALIDVEDARAEHAIVLVIHKSIAEEAVRPWVAAFNARVAGFERISEIVRVAEIPRGSLGKVRRLQLRQMVAEAQK